MSKVKAAVLVVEDEPLIRLAAMDLIEGAGYEAIEATNADDAFASSSCGPTFELCSPMWTCLEPWMA
jgi:CheY-like chemotaxis protein